MESVLPITFDKMEFLLPLFTLIPIPALTIVSPSIKMLEEALTSIPTDVVLLDDNNVLFVIFLIISFCAYTSSTKI